MANNDYDYHGMTTENNEKPHDYHQQVKEDDVAYDYHGAKNKVFNENEKQQKSGDEKHFYEETSAEITPTLNNSVRQNLDNEELERVTAKRLGVLGLSFSIISLFVLPIILGVSGVIVGFVARRKGSASLGGWAIGIGIVSLITTIFLAPLL
ncbi:DUF308 domain-containing protein [Bacillus carboniphilus]|uniref:DUF308 domain-containing protein n=1 Tax=Bacillus carboniphilus TaxID=86663 RepID=A0ABY9JX52_9BACI|nr:DUF308 domain-containing protein [Bacillus carboniphilus]WLR43959.1 DUF308 domain-containing protein [Bacillus carboniphilus]